MYRAMYLQLFNAVTDSLAAMERMDFGAARALLIAAQQACEETYLRSGGTAGQEGLRLYVCAPQSEK